MAAHARSSRFFQFLLTCIAAAGALPALGNSQDATPFQARYPVYYGTNGCGSCHTNGIPPALHSYGTAYRTAVLALGGRTGSNPNAALGNIENGDADGDGYTNGSELKNGAGYAAHSSASHPTASVSSTSAQAAKSGAPNTTVSYSVTVTNNGNIPDSFTLSANVTAGQVNWTMSIVGSASNVAPGGTASITVNVAIPVSATNGQTSTANFVATSQARSLSTGSIALTTTATVAAATGPRYVNPAGANNTDCRSSQTPCKTITYAVSQAQANDPIYIAPGVYNTALGEVFPIAMKSGGALQSTGSAYNTIIDGAGGTAGLLDWSGNTNNAAGISDITFRNGLRVAENLGVALGGAVKLSGNTGIITIQRCIFRNNESRGYSGPSTLNPTGGPAWGGGVYVSSSAVQIRDSVFTGNIVRGGNGFSNPGGTIASNYNGGFGQGGAIYFAGTGNIANNTFSGNQAIGGNGGAGTNGSAPGGAGQGGAVAATGNPAPSVYNSIFYFNSASSGTGTNSEASMAGAVIAGNAPTNTKNLFFGNTANGASSTGDTPGTAFIGADPQFHHPSKNLHIGMSSPARGAGASPAPSSFDLDMRVRPNPPSIGAYEASGADMPYMDLEGNGKSDLLYRNTSTGEVYRLLMNGTAVASGAMAYVEGNTAWKPILDADFNADGITDLLWLNSVNGQVFMQLFGANGLPASGAIIYTEGNAAWKIIAAPDLDGDGNADLLWYNTSTGQVYGMILSGFAITGAGMIHTEANTQWMIAGVGDMAGSGRQNQIVWRNTATGQVYLMTVSFNGAFSQSGAIVYNSTLPYKIVAIADFNGDGKSDLLWREDNTGAVYMVLFNGSAVLSEGVIYQEASPNWKIVASGDYNGDGKADILWRNLVTGQVYMMLMNGGSITGAAVVYNEANTAWKILGPYEYAQ